MTNITELARGQAVIDQKRSEIQGLIAIVNLFISKEFNDEYVMSPITRIVIGDHKFSVQITSTQLSLRRDIPGPNDANTTGRLTAKSLRVEEVPVIHLRLFSAIMDIFTNMGHAEAFKKFCALFSSEAMTKILVFKAHRGGYKAQQEGRSEIWAAGRTPSEALFDLFLTHGSKFGITVEAVD